MTSGHCSTIDRLILLWYYQDMPTHARGPIRDLERAGFVDRGGSGSHRNFRHPRGAKITLSGDAGDDAKHYQERAVASAIEKSRR